MSYEITKHCVLCGQGMAFDPLDLNDLCLDCIDDEPDGPQECDWVTSDYVTFASFGTRERFVVKSDWTRELAAHMEAQQFWPSIWFISDHGNVHLIQIERHTVPDPEE